MSSSVERLSCLAVEPSAPRYQRANGSSFGTNGLPVNGGYPPSRKRREFDPVEMEMLARRDCLTCGGFGVIPWEEGAQGVIPCSCALRGAFRECFSVYRELVSVRSAGGELASTLGRSGGGYVQRIKYDRPPPGAKQQPLSFCRTAECYMTDFFLLARNCLREGNGSRWRLFRRYFLDDAGACLKAAGMESRAELFRVLHGIEASAGREFYQVRPYPLWPPSKYWGNMR